IPDGYFDLVAKFENGILSGIQLTGVWIKPIQVSIPQSTKIFAIRFKLLATEYLFQQEIKSILNTTKALPLTFWSIHTYSMDDFEKFAAEVTNRLENAIKHLHELDTRKLQLFELAYSRRNPSVEALAGSVFWSSRQINRYFNQQYGFSLKIFLNIIRCNASYEAIAKGKLYPEDSYFDQAHFIKEIKKHTGATPGELSKNENVRFLQLSTKSFR
ncbi:helix-turn-helix domain-containing protein, partial [Chitinophaga sp.]|uniref:helix-turn-helix domain-containing protein n=1 Tax=Chitinophaga sp. TaxID=1869181 RepID=UPI002FDCF557